MHESLRPSAAHDGLVIGENVGNEKPWPRTAVALRLAMRILIAHNAYQQRGGEDVVVEAERELLTSYGHEVRLFSRHNDDIVGMPRSELALQTVWSRSTTASLTEELHDFRPQVLHVHNTFPLLSPSAYWAAASAHVPVVQTLHNFRLLCPQATFLREGRVCEDCLGKVPWRAALHRCYRGSSVQSAVLAGAITLHRGLGTWQRKVTRYIALNEFCRQMFAKGGLPANRIVVKPNFVDLDAPREQTRGGFLYVGRLSAEKGAAVLAAASAAMPEAAVRMAGVGPEAALLARLAPSAAWLGALERSAVQAEMARAAVLVLPSVCYESFPLVVVEAFASGLPVIASRLGALPELVQDGVTGLLFEPGSAEDLQRKMRWALAHPAETAAMGRNARARYEADYTAQRNHELLIRIYQGAIDEVA